MTPKQSQKPNSLNAAARGPDWLKGASTAIWELTQLAQSDCETVSRFVATHESNQWVGSRKSMNLPM
jgi:hypothetical protein